MCWLSGRGQSHHVVHLECNVFQPGNGSCQYELLLVLLHEVPVLNALAARYHGSQLVSDNGL